MSIMTEETVLVIAWYRLAQLLNRPFSRWVLCHVAMKNATGSDFHDHKNIETLKARSDGDHEVACQEGSRMITHKCVPRLRVPTGPWVFDWPIRPNRPRRDTDTELQP
jgi:hypothetical protein